MGIFEVAKNFHEIDFFYLTSFFGLDFFKFSDPMCNILLYKILLYYSDDNRLVSDYEEVNSSNCITMIAVMPAGSGNGTSTTLASQPALLAESQSTPDSTSLLASRSETSSSEGQYGLISQH